MQKSGFLIKVGTWRFLRSVIQFKPKIQKFLSDFFLINTILKK